MHKHSITILTPTYNRENVIKNLYYSLIDQTVKDFQWIIIDDGSQDDTYKLIHSWIDESRLDILYLCKDNGGKHSALNYAHQFINGELVIIVDSDDYLLDNAIETVLKDWKLYKTNKTICGLSYQRGKVSGELISAHYSEEYLISDHISCRINGTFGGDRCEVLRTDILKEFPFPEYSGEKFMSEGWLWMHIAYQYKTVYINKVIYVCEYLEDGLTKSGRALRMKSPMGMMENCNSFFIKRVRLRTKIKQSWLYINYGKCAGLNYIDIIKKTKHKFLIGINYPMGYLLYKYWSYKYLNSDNFLLYIYYIVSFLGFN